MTEEKNTKHTGNDDEIDLIALAKTIWVKRRFLIKTVLIFALLGVVVALLSPKEYSASSTIVPQVSGDASKSNLSSLAAMAGFNLNSGEPSSELSPMVYPQIVQSVPFQLELMNTTFSFADLKAPVTLFEYYNEYKKPGLLANVKKYTLGLPFVLIGAIKGKPDESAPLIPNSDAIALSQEQEEVRKMLAEHVSLEANDKEGILVLRAVFPEARLAAQIAEKAQLLLQQYITEFKIKKASAQLDFIRERYQEKKHEFEAAQASLAAFRDRNKNVTSALARTQEERLQSNYQIAFNVYSELAKQLEQAQIQVKEDTPVFAVIKPVSVPLEDNNSGFMTLVIWTFLGIIIALAWIFGQQFYASAKEKWHES